MLTSSSDWPGSLRSKPPWQHQRLYLQQVATWPAMPQPPLLKRQGTAVSAAARVTATVILSSWARHLLHARSADAPSLTRQLKQVILPRPPQTAFDAFCGIQRESATTTVPARMTTLFSPPKMPTCSTSGANGPTPEGLAGNQQVPLLLCWLLPCGEQAPCQRSKHPTQRMESQPLVWNWASTFVPVVLLFCHLPSQLCHHSTPTLS